MTIPKDMIDKEDFDRMEAGLPPRPKKKRVIKPPEPPKVENQIDISKVPIQLKKIEGVSRTMKNPEGVSFIGYEIVITPEDGPEITGWMVEGDVHKIKNRVPEDMMVRFDLTHIYTRERIR